jgi:NADH:ubiquinone oxidoreductase subunit 6 (subunit J)
MIAEQCLFWLFATLACGGAISVAICQSVVRMAMSLIVCLASVSALFFLLHADFVGAVQLMVYVFGIMLTASAPFLKIRASPAEGFLAAGIGVFFLAVIAFTVAGISDLEWSSIDRNLSALTTPSDVTSGYNDSSSGNTTRPLALSFLGLRPDKGGNAPGYLLPFEIVSVHLLVVLIGAAYLARPKRRVSAEE